MIILIEHSYGIFLFPLLSCILAVILKLFFKTLWARIEEEHKD